MLEDRPRHLLYQLKRARFEACCRQRHQSAYNYRQFSHSELCRSVAFRRLDTLQLAFLSRESGPYIGT